MWYSSHISDWVFNIGAKIAWNTRHVYDVRDAINLNTPVNSMAKCNSNLESILNIDVVLWLFFAYARSKTPSFLSVNFHILFPYYTCNHHSFIRFGICYHVHSLAWLGLARLGFVAYTVYIISLVQLDIRHKCTVNLICWILVPIGRR